MTEASSPRPIRIAEYNPEWPVWFMRESDVLRQVCAEWLTGLEHIGSTAVPGLGAKPVIDIMLAITGVTQLSRIIEALVGVGYLHRPGFAFELPGRFDFVCKDIGGERRFNLHIAEADGVFWHRHLLFRDTLRRQPETARAYEALKRQLAERYSPDIEAYATAKTEFIRAIEAAAQSSPG